MSQVRADQFSDAYQAANCLAAAKSHKTDRGNLFDLHAIIAAGVAVRLVAEDGETVGGYVVQPFGRALWITAAAGRAGVPLCPVIDAHATEQARRGGYDAVAFRTERRGMVLRAAHIGYDLVREDGSTFYMRKSVK